MVIVILAVLPLILLFTAVWLYQAGKSSWGNPLAPLAFLLICLIGVDALVILLIGAADQTMLTSLIAFLGFLCAGLAYLLKKILDILDQRARVLIQEHLASGPKSRSELRNHVHQDSMQFRIFKSAYISAIEALLASGNLTLTAAAKYKLRSST